MEPATTGDDTLRGFIIGSVVGFVLVYAFIVVVMWLAGIELVAALASALFIGLFGGIGFGGMLGAANARSAKRMGAGEVVVGPVDDEVDTTRTAPRAETAPPSAA